MTRCYAGGAGGGGGRNPFGRSSIEIEQQPFRHGVIGTPLSPSLSLSLSLSLSNYISIHPSLSDAFSRLRLSFAVAFTFP